MLQFKRTKESEMGVVYFIQAGTNGPIKIGHAKDLMSRLREHQISNSEHLRILAAVDGTYELEAALHVYFYEKKISGEWFDLTNEEVADIISEIIRGTYTESEKEGQRSQTLRELAALLRTAPKSRIDFEKVREIFGDRKKIFSEELAEALGYSPKQLSVYLGTFGIRPKKIRRGITVLNGYAADDFAHIWERMENPFVAKKIRDVT